MKRAAVLGGYNLVRIARLTFLFSDPYCRFQFCSIMALEAADSNGMEAPVHRNAYRTYSDAFQESYPKRILK